jgi:predicted DNA-binding transcriptional regulator YafY
MSKYERLLHVLNLLRSRKNLRAVDLAKECEVSERTIYRDLVDLSSANIPIYFDDGYKLLTDAFLPPLNFSLEDYLTLKAGLTSTPLVKQSSLAKSARRVLAKIESSLPPGLKAQFIDITTPLRINVKTTSDFSKQHVIFDLLEKAIVHQRKIKITYESLESGQTQREVDPYNLVFRRHSWYLVAFCYLRKEVRVFRINRVKNITLLNEKFKKIPGFSIDEFFKDSWEIYQGIPCEVRIKFYDRAVKVIESGPHHPSESITKLGEGSLIYKVRVRGLEEISRWILGFGGNAEVLHPPELREKLKKIGEALVRIYK